MKSCIITPKLGLIIITTTTIFLQIMPPTHTASTATDSSNDGLPFHDCGDAAYSYSAGSTFEGTLNATLFTQLPLYSPTQTYANFTSGTGIDRVSALYFCRGDIGVSACHICIQNSVQKIVQQCKFKKQGIIWHEFCTLRYANQSILSLDEKSPYRMYYNRTSLVSELHLGPHRQLFKATMSDLVTAAANHDNATSSGFFYAKEANLSSSLKLRGLAQCSPFIGSSRLCESCVRAAYNRMDLWSNTLVFLPSCHIRFVLYGQPRLPPSSSARGSDSKTTIILAVLLPVIVILILLGGFWFWKRRRSPGTNSPDGTEEQINNTEAREKKNVVEVTGEDAIITEATALDTNNTKAEGQGLTRFTYSEVEDMTDNFQKILGEGTYGVVYYGRLASGSEVAVKLLSKSGAPKQFSNEIDGLGRISQENLVSLYGYYEGAILGLVYEYMPGGDLKALLSERSNVVVSWKERLAIAFDIAQGLYYLHTGCSPGIVHEDVKPTNILLNNHLQAKLADFGFSKIFPPDYISKLETRDIGRTGYIDPQHHSAGKVNAKGDVYSFGVVLLELITGKTAIRKRTTDSNLVEWVMNLFERGDIGSILDPRLRTDVGEDCTTVWRLIRMAKKCVEVDESHRPTMSLIVTELRWLRRMWRDEELNLNGDR